MYKPPLILTLALDEVSADYFTKLRDQYFPKHCNYLEAHLTLFHHLPANENVIDEALIKLCTRNLMKLEVTGIKNLGNGVAFTILSNELAELHVQMQQSFAPWLISQDKNKLWPHITIQNKVTAYKALQTTALLQKDFTPFVINGIGINSWKYLGGPWERQRELRFQG